MERFRAGPRSSPVAPPEEESPFRSGALRRARRFILEVHDGREATIGTPLRVSVTRRDVVVLVDRLHLFLSPSPELPPRSRERESVIRILASVREQLGGAFVNPARISAARANLAYRESCSSRMSRDFFDDFVSLGPTALVDPACILSWAYLAIYQFGRREGMHLILDASRPIQEHPLQSGDIARVGRVDCASSARNVSAPAGSSPPSAPSQSSLGPLIRDIHPTSILVFSFVDRESATAAAAVLPPAKKSLRIELSLEDGTKTSVANVGVNGDPPTPKRRRPDEEQGAIVVHDPPSACPSADIIIPSAFTDAVKAFLNVQDLPKDPEEFREVATRAMNFAVSFLREVAAAVNLPAATSTEIARRVSELIPYRGDLERLEREKSRALADIQTENGRLLNLSAQTSELERRKHRAEEELANTERTNQQALIVRSTAQNALERLEGELSAKRAEITSLDNQIEIRKGKRAGLEADLADKAKRTDTAKAELERLLKEKNDTAREVEEARKKFEEEAEARTSSKTEAFARLIEERKKKLTEEVAVLVEQKKKLSEEIAQLKREKQSTDLYIKEVARRSTAFRRGGATAGNADDLVKALETIRLGAISEARAAYLAKRDESYAKARSLLEYADSPASVAPSQGTAKGKTKAVPSTSPPAPTVDHEAPRKFVYRQLATFWRELGQGYNDLPDSTPFPLVVRIGGPRAERAAERLSARWKSLVDLEESLVPNAVTSRAGVPVDLEDPESPLMILVTRYRPLETIGTDWMYRFRYLFRDSFVWDMDLNLDWTRDPGILRAGSDRFSETVSPWILYATEIPARVPSLNSIGEVEKARRELLEQKDVRLKLIKRTVSEQETSSSMTSDQAPDAALEEALNGAGIGEILQSWEAINRIDATHATEERIREGLSQVETLVHIKRIVTAVEHLPRGSSAGHPTLIERDLAVFLSMLSARSDEIHSQLDIDRAQKERATRGALLLQRLASIKSTIAPPQDPRE